MSEKIHKHEFGEDGRCNMCKVARKDVIPSASKPDTAVTILARIEHQLASMEKTQSDLVKTLDGIPWLALIILGMVGMALLIAWLVSQGVKHL